MLPPSPRILPAQAVETNHDGTKLDSDAWLIEILCWIQIVDRLVENFTMDMQPIRRARQDSIWDRKQETGPTMDAAKVMQTLISLSERAANVARVVRSHSELFESLIQEKDFDTRRKKSDFKTLADVTIQETIRYFLGREFPYLGAQVRGEETYGFTAKSGKFLSLQIVPNASLMKDLFRGVLGGDEAAAVEITKAVYDDPDLSGIELDKAKSINLQLPEDRFGVWVDPLDATSEYINAGSATARPPSHGVFLSGIHCVTILIGVFDLKTGEPVAGVINQPFYHMDEHTKKWQSRCVWGISYHGVNVNSQIRCERPLGTGKAPVVILSPSETNELKEALDERFTTIYAAGAGYKFLSLLLGLADSYVLSRATTFKWDSCAPHAILRSVGGGCCDLAKALVNFDLHSVQNNRKYELQYLHPDDPDRDATDCWLNEGGILAYASLSDLAEIVATLRQVMAEGVQLLES
ncbi:hypothetical protein RvY_09970 [Ramazzottius varieornatus]|uniref:Inositol polyphosphate 1-phosphatase n=1 Tax=Ramazzottius varieornatus TaxID=947166 RepID=A0A1D1VGJ4_RAMVA|nr:hypothetical protein RvY_09970 [Ramazzottius varieornatus]